MLDEGLTRILNFPYEDHSDERVRARNIFRAYANRWEDCDGLPAVENIESKEHADLIWALDWLKENFTGLWT